MWRAYNGINRILVRTDKFRQRVEIKVQGLVTKDFLKNYQKSVCLLVVIKPMKVDKIKRTTNHQFQKKNEYHSSIHKGGT